jgi:hypothetical protein
LLGREIVAGGAEQPAAAGIEEAWPLLIRRERRQQCVEQAAIDRAHVGVEIAGHMNDRVKRSQCCDPRFGRSDIAGDCCHADLIEPCRGGG